MVFFVRITVNQSHLRPICKSTKFNPKIQRTIYLINFQQLRLHVPDFIRTVVFDDMEEKYESFKQKILKLNELALRGEEGEAINARKAMVRLCSTLGVNLEDILNESEQKKEYVFNVGCDHLLKELFFMCSEKILGDGEIWYKEKNSHISLELTPSQYAELFTYFDFHKENFKKELKATRKRLLLAYLLKHNIYVGNDDGTDKELSSEERRNAWKTLQMVDGLENVSYLKSLEDK